MKLRRENESLCERYSRYEQYTKKEEKKGEGISPCLVKEGRF
jgi:hypothetical protein